MKSIRLCVFGSKRLKNYRLLKQKLDRLLSNLDLTEIEWISGCYEGTDLLGERYAISLNIPIKRYEENWVESPDKHNRMAQYSTHAIGFIPDYCESEGSSHMIEQFKSNQVKLKTVKFNRLHGGDDST